LPGTTASIIATVTATAVFPGGTAATTNKKLRPVKRSQLFYPAKSNVDFYLLPITG
jgi:hypothetical protein